MVNRHHFRRRILDRLEELDARLHEIDEELGHDHSKDLTDQAVDLEDDEVLEGLGVAAQREVGLLKRALARIKDGSYGTCLKCGDPIAEERLEAVLHAPLCRTCAGAGAG